MRKPPTLEQVLANAGQYVVHDDRNVYRIDDFNEESDEFTLTPILSLSKDDSFNKLVMKSKEALTRFIEVDISITRLDEC